MACWLRGALVAGLLATAYAPTASAQQYGLTVPLGSAPGAKVAPTYDTFEQAPGYAPPSQTSLERDVVRRDAARIARERIRQREARRVPSVRYGDPLAAYTDRAAAPGFPREGANVRTQAIQSGTNRSPLVPQR